MVRINLVEPSTLTDQHLIAEHNEILMLCGCLKKSLRSKRGVHGIPEKFTLGKGHIKFFYNKGRYVHSRFAAIQIEMICRGFSPQKRFPKEEWPEELYNDWKPSSEDIQIVERRIKEKLAKKPDWYKYRGKKLDNV